MPPMRNIFHEAEETVFGHFRHGHQADSPLDRPQDQPQETHMTASKLSAAREAISAIADNPLIDAIAEAGIGRWMTPAEVQAVVAVWREVEHYRAQAAAAPKIDLQPEQQTSAQQLQPQQTA